MAGSVAAAPGALDRASQSSLPFAGIHVDVDTFNFCPSVRGYFERQDASGAAQECMFMDIEGSATDAAKAKWQAELVAVDGLRLTPEADAKDAAFGNFIRTDFVDSGGAVWASRWRDLDTGFVAQAAVYGADGHVLQFRRFKNLVPWNSGMGGSLSCGQQQFMKNSIMTGPVADHAKEIQILMKLADLTTQYCLAEVFHMPENSPAPEGQSQGPGPSASVAGPKAEAADTVFLGGKQLLLAPNPASGQAAIYFRLEKAASVRLLMSDLAGDVVERRDLGSLAAGGYQEAFRASDFANGDYLLMLETDEGYGLAKRASFKVAVKH